MVPGTIEIICDSLGGAIVLNPDCKAFERKN